MWRERGLTKLKCEKSRLVSEFGACLVFSLVCVTQVIGQWGRYDMRYTKKRSLTADNCVASGAAAHRRGRGMHENDGRVTLFRPSRS